MLDSSTDKDVRTSNSHPLRIDEVEFISPFNLGSMTMGMTLTPGLKSEGIHCIWDRDVEDDVKVIDDWKPDLILSTHIRCFGWMRSLSDGDRLTKLNRTADFEDRSWPVPEDVGESQWRIECIQLKARGLQSGSKVLVLGGTGSEEVTSLGVTALMAFGAPAEEAIRAVRAARPGHWSTQAQKTHFAELAKNLEGGAIQ